MFATTSSAFSSVALSNVFHVNSIVSSTRARSLAEVATFPPVNDARALYRFVAIAQLSQEASVRAGAALVNFHCLGARSFSMHFSIALPYFVMMKREASTARSCCHSLKVMKIADPVFDVERSDMD